MLAKSRKVKCMVVWSVLLVFMTQICAGCGNQIRAKGPEKKLELAIHYLSEKQFEKAILTYQEVIKIDNKLAEAYQGLSRVYQLQGKSKKASDILQKGLDCVANKEELIRLRLSLGGAFVSAGNYKNAEDVFLAIIRDSPGCIDAYRGLALVYQAQGNDSGAQDVLGQAVTKNPRRYEAFNELARLLFASGQPQQGMNEIAESLELNPNQYEAYNILEDNYAGNWTQLIKSAEGIMNAKTSALIKLFGRYKNAQYADALNIYNTLLKEDKNNQKACVLAALTSFYQGDRKSADQLLMGFKPTNDAIKVDLAKYYLITNQKRNALELAEQVNEHDPNNLEAVVFLYTYYKESDPSLAGQYATSLMVHNWVMVDELIQTFASRGVEVSWAAKVDNNGLSMDYFFPKPGIKATYRVVGTGEGSRNYDYLSTWRKVSANLYERETKQLDKGYIHISTYKNAGDEALLLQEKGEKWLNKRISGKEIKFRKLRTGESIPVKWVTELTLTDSQDNQGSNYDEVFKFIGFENMNVLGKKMKVAHFQAKGSYRPHYRGHYNQAENYTLDIWYAKGMGSIKSSYSKKDYTSNVQLISFND